MIMDKTQFPLNLGVSRASLLVATTPAQSKPMTVFSAGVGIVSDKAPFRADWAVSRTSLQVVIGPVQSKRMILCNAGGVILME